MNRIILALLMSALASVGCFSQQDVAKPAPSSLVVVFRCDSSKFSSFLLDGRPIAANQVPMEYPSVWPVAPGKHELLLSANGAEDARAALEIAPHNPTLLILDLVPNKDASKAARFPNQITLSARPIALEFPKSDTKSVNVYAYLLEGQPLKAKVDFGRSEPKIVELPAKTLVSLGQGSLAVSVGKQSVFGANPGNPGVYVFALLPLPDGKIRALPFEFVVKQPEPPPNGRPRLPTDY
jgi:hypothetical protein